MLPLNPCFGVLLLALSLAFCFSARGHAPEPLNRLSSTRSQASLLGALLERTAMRFASPPILAGNDRTARDSTIEWIKYVKTLTVF